MCLSWTLTSIRCLWDWVRKLSPGRIEPEWTPSKVVVFPVVEYLGEVILLAEFESLPRGP